LANLDGIIDFPYMAFSEDEYRSWFALSGSSSNTEKDFDILLGSLMGVEPKRWMANT
jgi:hypothetical protein